MTCHEPIRTLNGDTLMTTDAAIGDAVPTRIVPAGTPVAVLLTERDTDELMVRLPGTRFAAFVSRHDTAPAT